MPGRALLLLLFVSLGVAAQERLSLEAALAETVRTHPRLTRQREQLLASQFESRRVESELYPHLSLELVAKDGPQGVPNFRLLGLANAGYPQSAGGGLVLTQTFDFGRSSQKLAAQQFLSQAEDEDGEAERAALLLSVLRVYGQAVLCEDLLGLAADTVRARQDILRQAESRYQAGLVSRVDSRLAGADAALAVAEQREMQSQAALARAQLLSALGRTQASSPLLDGLPAQLEVWGNALEVDLAEARSRRPEVQATLARQEAASAQLEVARSGGNPWLTFFASGGYVANLNGPNANPTAYAAGLALNLPIYTAGGLEADIGRAEHVVAAAKARHSEMLQAVALQVKEAHIRFSNFCAKRAALELQLQSAQDGCRLARTRYAIGLGDIVELQQTEIALLRAESQLRRNRADIWLARGDLLYVTGKINELCKEGDPQP